MRQEFERKDNINEEKRIIWEMQKQKKDQKWGIFLCVPIWFFFFLCLDFLFWVDNFFLLWWHQNLLLSTSFFFLLWFLLSLLIYTHRKTPSFILQILFWLCVFLVKKKYHSIYHFKKKEDDEAQRHHEKHLAEEKIRVDTDLKALKQHEMQLAAQEKQRHALLVRKTEEDNIENEETGRPVHLASPRGDRRFDVAEVLFFFLFCFVLLKIF